MRKFVKNPYAERIRQNGCTIRVTRGDGDARVTVEERVVTPEEVRASNEQRDAILRSRRVQR
jgi:hypothetical protein